MITPFEFRLIGADAPDGQLDVDHAVAILSKLQELAIRVGRVESGSAGRGCPSRQVERLARLRFLALKGGSTCIHVSRAADDDALDFDLADERGLDDRFQAIVEAIADDVRPEWVSDPVADSAADLTAALQRAAPEVAFSTGGVERRRFRTEEVHRETWHPAVEDLSPGIVTLVGRLEKVDLKSHDFRVRDDVGNGYSLPKVANDIRVSHLIGSYVSVTGVADRDARGRVSGIRDAEIVAVPEPIGVTGTPESVPLEEILASASGLEFGGIAGITEPEAVAYFEAMGL